MTAIAQGFIESWGTAVERSHIKLRVQGGQRPANETIQIETIVHVCLRVIQNVNILCVHRLYGEPMMAQR